jgi:hypothetical protein
MLMKETSDTHLSVRARSHGRALKVAAALVLAVASYGSARTGLAAEDVAKLAKQAADLRNEVERLSTELSSKRGDLENQLKSLARQKAELEAERGREQVRLQKVRQLVSDKRAVIEQQQAEEAKLRPAFEVAVKEVRAYVEQSLPFRRHDRLAELSKIEDQFKQGLLTPERALSRLWSHLEDEFRLTGESGLYRQSVNVDGKEQLADIVRVGMVAFYYRTPDGGYGHTTRDRNGQWALVAVNGKEERKQIDGLFESFKKQLRIGLFPVPQALPAPDTTAKN